jgi:gamma-glutamyl:cysteine ligase YbdK (ATP-grasp superfamily)
MATKFEDVAAFLAACYIASLIVALAVALMRDLQRWSSVRAKPTKSGLVEIRIADAVLRRFGNRELIEHIRASAGGRLSGDGTWVCNLPDLLVQEMLDVQSAA